MTQTAWIILATILGAFAIVIVVAVVSDHFAVKRSQMLAWKLLHKIEVKSGHGQGQGPHDLGEVAPELLEEQFGTPHLPVLEDASEFPKQLPPWDE